MNVPITQNATLTITDVQSDYGDWKFPLLLSCLAGASTSVGAGIVFLFSPSTIQQSMSFSLSLAASVMITVSVISIGPECLDGIFEFDVTTGASTINIPILSERIGSFAAGCGSYYLLSRLLATLPEPESYLAATATLDLEHTGIEGYKDTEQKEVPLLSFADNSPTPPKKMEKCKFPRGAAMRRAINRDAPLLTASLSRSSNNLRLEGSDDDDNNDNNNHNNSSAKVSFEEKVKPTNIIHNAEDRRRSWRVAMLLFVSLLCHNFPEGLAVVASTAESRELGVTVAIGILIHNIPEGIAIAVPSMAARPDAPWLAFGLASVSGLAEPLGALLALSVLHSVERLPLENILACVAGIMCMVAVLELYPEAYRHVRNQNIESMVWGTLLGMLTMVMTEWYLH